MNKKMILATVAATLTLATAYAANQLYFKTQGTAEMSVLLNENNQTTIVTKTPKFQPVLKYTDNAGVQVEAVVEQMITQTMRLYVDGVEGEVVIRVRGGDKLKSILWEKKENATNSSFESEIGAVVTTLGGCCDSADTHRAYDVKTGKLLLSYSVPADMNSVSNLPFVLEVPNSKLAPRMIGVITLNATRDTDFVDTVDGRQKIALVKYTSRDGGFQKIQVDTKVPENFGANVETELVALDMAGDRKPEINRGRATLWNADQSVNPKDISGVAIKLTIYNGDGTQIVVIPVVADRLDVSKATVPAGVMIRTLN